MEEFFGSLKESKRFQGLIFAWMAPIFAAALVSVVFLLPELKATGVVKFMGSGIEALGLSGALFLVLASAVTAIMAFMMKRYLYWILEGILWPDFLRRRRIRVHELQFDYLTARAELPADLADEYRYARLEAINAVRRDRGIRWLPRRSRPVGTPRDLNSENTHGLRVYPSRKSQLMPTRFGNRMRAMETYALRSFGLDSQTMWSELVSVAPGSVTNELDAAEESSDAFVCSLYCLGVLLMLSIATVIWRASSGDLSVYGLSLGVASSLLMVVAYRGLIASVESWEDAVRALVNVGRVPLAEKLGLSFPVDPARERAMWRSVTRASYWAGTERGLEAQEELTQYRKASKPASKADPD